MTQKALRKCLPSWALLGLDFIGSSVLKIITDVGLAERTIATLRVMGTEQITGFDTLEVAARKPQRKEAGREQNIRNRNTVAYRLQKNADNNQNKCAGEQYQNTLQKASQKLRESGDQHEHLPRNSKKPTEGKTLMSSQ